MSTKATEMAISTKAPVLVLHPARVESVHDADTIHVSLPMYALIPGADEWLENVRVAKVNAAELSTDAGKRAAIEVANLLGPGGPTSDGHELLVYGRDKYGRLLADLTLRDGKLLSEFVMGLPGSSPMNLREQLVGSL